MRLPTSTPAPPVRGSAFHAGSESRFRRSLWSPGAAMEAPLDGVRQLLLSQRLREFWATDPALPVLYMSGFTPERLEFLPTEEQERRWILKPFSVPDLLARLASYLPSPDQAVPQRRPPIGAT